MDAKFSGKPRKANFLRSITDALFGGIRTLADAIFGQPALEWAVVPA